MKDVDIKVSCLLNNIIMNWFDLQDAFERVFNVSMNDFVDLKVEFDEAHSDDEQ